MGCLQQGQDVLRVSFMELSDNWPRSELPKAPADAAFEASAQSLIGKRLHENGQGQRNQDVLSELV